MSDTGLPLLGAFIIVVALPVIGWFDGPVLLRMVIGHRNMKKYWCCRCRNLLS